MSVYVGKGAERVGGGSGVESDSGSRFLPNSVFRCGKKMEEGFYVQKKPSSLKCYLFFLFFFWLKMEK